MAKPPAYFSVPAVALQRVLATMLSLLLLLACCCCCCCCWCAVVSAAPGDSYYYYQREADADEGDGFSLEMMPTRLGGGIRFADVLEYRRRRKRSRRRREGAGGTSSLLLSKEHRRKPTVADVQELTFESFSSPDAPPVEMADS